MQGAMAFASWLRCVYRYVFYAVRARHQPHAWSPGHLALPSANPRWPFSATAVAHHQPHRVIHPAYLPADRSIQRDDASARQLHHSSPGE